MRWNALAMVARANAAYGELGGHIASYASAADLFEVGFNHFFHARNDATGHGGDLCSSSRTARRASTREPFEGRLSENDLSHYRRRTGRPRRRGARSVELSASVPDARLLAVPDRLDGHWPDQLDLSGALHALSQPSQSARLRGRKVWGVFGDGEMDEPESMSALTLAAREGLDNLIWVVNCNLQRLDGPVRGNGAS